MALSNIYIRPIMPNSIPTPNRWGHLTLLADSYLPKMARDHEGNEYIEDTHGTRMMNFRCDCGREFAIPKDQWPGRRIMRDCGEDCRLRKPKPPKRAPGLKGRTYSFYCVDVTMNAIYALAAIWGISGSRAVEVILSAYVAQHPLKGQEAPPMPSVREAEPSQQPPKDPQGAS